MQRSIYSYTDYREFIRDTYAHLKDKEGLTLRDFARKAGFNTHTFLTNVIAGKRSLTAESAGKVGRGLSLKPEQRTYLELMVRFANAKTIDDKNDVYEQMCASSPKDEVKKIGSEYFEIFRNAYVLTVRELVALSDFKEDAKWIARKIHPPITSGQAEKALETLISTKLLVRNAKGKLVQANPDLTTGAEVKSLAVAVYHKQLLDLADKSIDGTRAQDRDISSLSLNISKSEFDFIKKRTAGFRSEMLDYLKKKRENVIPSMPHERERVIYYLNMQFFNATSLPW